MKNIQKQYTDLLEGKMSKANFMRNVRMQFPQYISPVTSYDDSIKILKGKRILSESLKNYDEIKVLSKPEEPKIKSGGSLDLDIMLRDLYTKPFLGGYYLDYNFDNPNRLIIHISKEPAKEGQRTNEIEKLGTAECVKGEWHFDGVRAGDDDQEILDKIAAAAFPNINEVFKLKVKRTLSEAKQSIGVYGHNPSAEVTKYPNFDTVNYNQLMKGMKYELALMGEITDENLVLAKEKALKALTKDPMAYRELMIANQKAITEMDKDLKMKDVKADNKVDKANGMKVVKKDAPASANQSKKFTNKVEKVIQMTQTPKKVKGVEVMEVPGKEKIAALKESILKEFDSYRNEIPENFSKGQRVMTKDKKKVGEVTDVEQDTATVKLDDGSLEHIQLNVLTAKDVPAKEDKVEETVLSKDQMAQMGSGYPTKAEWDSMSHDERVAKLKNSAAAKYKNVEIRAKDDYDTLRKYNPGVLQAMAFPRSPLTVDDDAPAKEFPIKGDIGAAGEKFKKSLKEKMMKALEELLYKNSKTGQVQSFDQSHPEDKDIMKDPQFNQVFKKV